MEQYLYVAGGLSLGLVALGFWLADPGIVERARIRARARRRGGWWL